MTPETVPTPPRPDPTAEERFLDKVEVSERGCWIWTGHLDKKGYGQFWYEGRAVWAHRWSLWYWTGAMLDGLHSHHECRNPSCVNPEHLAPLTNGDNAAMGNRFRKLARPGPIT